jgi:hypothetical protein
MSEESVMEEDKEAKKRKQFRGELEHLFSLPLTRLGALSGVNKGKLPEWMLESKDKKVAKFLEDVSNVNSILESCYAVQTDNPFARLQKFYEIVQQRGVIECFVVLKFSAEAILNDPRIIVDNRSNELVTAALAVPMQLFVSGRLLYSQIIEVAEAIKYDHIDFLKYLQESCQEIVDEYQNGLAVMEGNPKNPAQLDKNTQVFGDIRKYVLRHLPSQEAPTLLEDIDVLINSYRQKLQLYIRRDENKIESKIVNEMLSNISVLLYFAKKINPNYECKSLKGLIFAVEELSIHAAKAAQKPIDAQSELATLNSGQAGIGPGAPLVFLEKIRRLFPSSPDSSESEELGTFRRRMSLPEKEREAFDKEQAKKLEARLSVKKGVTLDDIAEKSKLLEALRKNKPDWLDNLEDKKSSKAKMAKPFLDELRFIHENLLMGYWGNENYQDILTQKTGGVSSFDRLNRFYDKIVKEDGIQHFVDLRKNAQELSELYRASPLKKKFRLASQTKKIALEAIISSATTIPKQIFEESLREYEILIRVAQKAGNHEEVNQLKILRDRCDVLYGHYVDKLKAAGIESPRKVFREAEVQPAEPTRADTERELEQFRGEFKEKVQHAKEVMKKITAPAPPVRQQSGANSNNGPQNAAAPSPASVRRPLPPGPPKKTEQDKAPRPAPFRKSGQ